MKSNLKKLKVLLLMIFVVQQTSGQINEKKVEINNNRVDQISNQANGIVQPSSSVVITVTNFKINNVLIGSNPINFNNSSSVTLTYTVTLTTNDGTGNNILGNLFSKTEETNNSAILTQQYFQAITFIALYPATWQSITNVSIQLYANDFLPTGGRLKSFYKNNNNQNFDSSWKNIIGGTKNQIIIPTPTPTPSTIFATIYAGDRAPNIPLSSFNTTNGWWQLRFGNTNFTPPGFATSEGRAFNYASDTTSNLQLGYLYMSANIRKEYFIPYVGDRYSNEININVIPSPISNPQLYANGILTSGNLSDWGNQNSYYNFLLNSTVNIEGSPAYMNLIWPITGYESNVVPVTSYKWQYRKWNNIFCVNPVTTECYQNDWIDIPNQTSYNLNNFVPPAPENLKYGIRRIAIYNTISKAGTPIYISKSDNVDWICCTQNLVADSNGNYNPSTIIGIALAFNSTLANNNLTSSTLANFNVIYQWQQKDGRSTIWSDIVGATSQNYTPQQFSTQQLTYYRRIATCNYTSVSGLINGFYTSVSSVIYVTKSQSNRNFETTNNQQSSIKVYPIPSQSEIIVTNIESNDKLQITAEDLSAQKYSLQYEPTSDGKNISIDISRLSKGFYILFINNENDTITRKFIKE